MNFSGMLMTQTMLFLLILIGLWLRKSGIADDHAKRFVADLVISLTLPASILKSFQTGFTPQILKSCLLVIVVATLVQAGSYVLGRLLYDKKPEGRRQVLQYATAVSNSGVLGNAVAEGIFGELGVLYAAVYVLPQRIFMWSVGLTYFTEAPGKRELVKKVLTHPCIVAVGAGLVLMMTQFQLPEVLNRTLHAVAAANTPMAMMLVGMILGEVALRDMVEKETLVYCAVRLLLIPLLVMVPCALVGMDHLVAQVSVMLAGMPAASSTAALSAKYRKDELFATKSVVLSTLLSMVTVPMWCVLMAFVMP